MIIFRRRYEGIWALETSDAGNVWRDVRYQDFTEEFEPGDLAKSCVYQIETEGKGLLLQIATVLEDTLSDGWIDRAGYFWGNRVANHLTLALGIFGVPEPDALGWVHVSERKWRCAYPNLSPEQEHTLIKIGRYADDNTYRDHSVRFEKVFPKGYPLHRIPGVSSYMPQAQTKVKPAGLTP